MLNNRLSSILSILSTDNTVTAAELASTFDVTTRTIYRDIEKLAAAGLPVYMTKGKGGGVHLAAGINSAEYLHNSSYIAARLFIRAASADRIAPQAGLLAQEDGSLIVELSLPTTDQSMQWLLSFGNDCVVLEPPELRNRLSAMLQDRVEYYI